MTFSEKYFNRDRRRGAVWGGIIAAIVLLVGGSYVPGWQLDATAKQAVRDGQEVALVRALAPVCAERFRAQDDLSVQVAALKDTDTWLRDDFLVDRNLVVSSGAGQDVDKAIAEACADLLRDLVQ